MSLFTESTHFCNWIFDKESLREALKAANHRGISIIKSQILPDKPHSAAGFRSQRNLGNEESDFSNTDESGMFLTVEEESALKTWHLSLIYQMCGSDSDNERLRRSEKVQAGARALFQRFYLGNSIMIYDPKLIMLASIFLVSKIEDQIICIEELEKATNTREMDILAMEVPLLEGIRLHLRIYTPYPALLGLLDQVEKFIISSGGTVSGSSMSALHNKAWKIIDEILATDLPLLHHPARLGLAALLEASKTITPTPFNVQCFLDTRFGKENGYMDLMEELKQLADDFANMLPISTDLSLLKAINKKLKKCALWRSEVKDDDADGEKKKKKRKKNDKE